MRRHIMTFDDFGADSLASSPLDAILEIQEHKVHTITSKDALNPWLLSEEEYSTVELYFVILYYNGLIHATELLEGMVIKIPAASQVRKVLNSRRKQTQPRTVNI